jgi:uncharacterized SAM-binding protein YcdF (DUF218 family)
VPVRARQFRNKPRKNWLRLVFYFFFPFFFLIFCLIFLLVWKSGHALVHEDAFDNVDWAVVLAGQSRDCERTAAAIDLFKQNRIDTILLSSIRIFKSRFVGEFLIPDLVREGIPRERLYELQHDAYSTIEESRLIIQQFRGLGIDTVLVISSNYHTSRARMIFQHLAGGYPEFLFYPAPYDGYDSEAWWASRISLKLYILEWLKTFASRIELITGSHKNMLNNGDRTLQILPEFPFRSRFLRFPHNKPMEVPGINLPPTSRSYPVDSVISTGSAGISN